MTSSLGRMFLLCAHAQTGLVIIEPQAPAEAQPLKCALVCLQTWSRANCTREQTMVCVCKVGWIKQRANVFCACECHVWRTACHRAYMRQGRRESQLTTKCMRANSDSDWPAPMSVLVLRHGARQRRHASSKHNGPCAADLNRCDLKVVPAHTRTGWNQHVRSGGKQVTSRCCRHPRLCLMQCWLLART